MSWTPDEAERDLLLLFAMQNSLKHDGAGQTGSVMGSVMSGIPELRMHARELKPFIESSVQTANALAAEKGIDHLREILERDAPYLLETQVRKKREGLPELENVTKGEVVLRFAPNPNGPLSIGHSRGVVVNSEYARLYDGEWILRFDDTDTVRKPPLPTAYDMILEEVEWLCGRPPHRVLFASDRIEVYHRHAAKLIESGGAYVCTLSAEKFREFRLAKVDSPCRSQTVEENLSLWADMLDGKFSPGEAVVRIRTDMTLPNPALRDWPALRIQDTQANPHPRPEIGSRYDVWPLLDFQSAIEDHLQGVTHIIRGKDLMDSTRKQKLLYEHFDWTYPETVYWGRVKIHEFGGFSTSEMRSDIAAGVYSGWDDPRLPTLATLMRKGLEPQALRDFWIELALTQKDISAALSTLHSHNKNRIDARAPRLSFVREPSTLQINAENQDDRWDEVEVASHPDGGLGTRGLRLEWDSTQTEVIIESSDLPESGGSCRLKEWADLHITESGSARLDGTEPSGEARIIHWLPACTESSTPGVLLLAEGKTLHEVPGRLENNQHPAGTIVQLERIGYARIEADIDGVSQLVFLHS